jgi:hypothetical protein
MNSTQDSLQIQVNVLATPAQAYNAISRVQEWWTRDTEGETAHFGDQFTVRFNDTFVSFKITAADQDRKYVWHVSDCFLHWIEDKTEWKGTELVWEVEPVASGSLITMVHVGLTPNVECYNDCKSGWEHFVTSSLQKLINEGEGLPEGQRSSA